jgi:hypothetical protein
MAIFHVSKIPCWPAPTIPSLGPGHETDQEAQGDSGAGPLVGPELRTHWRTKLNDLLGRCTVHRTTIGVVGNTGAGERSPPT